MLSLFKSVRLLVPVHTNHVVYLFKDGTGDQSEFKDGTGDQSELKINVTCQNTFEPTLGEFSVPVLSIQLEFNNVKLVLL